MDDDEPQARNGEEAWERFMEAERPSVGTWRIGAQDILPDCLTVRCWGSRLRNCGSWPGRIRGEPKRGWVFYKHIDEFTLEDRHARAEAERALMNRIMERQQR